MSVIWFVYIYIIGAYISRYGFPYKKSIWIIAGLLSMIALLGVSVFNIQMPRHMRLASFCSPLPFFFSISLFYFMLKIRSFGNIVDRMIGSLSVSSLCIYLVQEQFSFRELFWPYLNIYSYSDSPYLICLWILTVIVIFGLAWIAHELFNFSYNKFFKPRVVTPLVIKTEYFIKTIGSNTTKKISD